MDTPNTTSCSDVNLPDGWYEGFWMAEYVYVETPKELSFEVEHFMFSYMLPVKIKVQNKRCDVFKINTCIDDEEFLNTEAENDRLNGLNG